MSGLFGADGDPWAFQPLMASFFFPPFRGDRGVVVDAIGDPADESDVTERVPVDDGEGGSLDYRLGYVFWDDDEGYRATADVRSDAVDLAHWQTVGRPKDGPQPGAWVDLGCHARLEVAVAALVRWHHVTRADLLAEGRIAEATMLDFVPERVTG